MAGKYILSTLYKSIIFSLFLMMLQSPVRSYAISANKLIDNFDNDTNWTDESNVRDAEWFVSSSTVYQRAMVSDVGGNTTPCLRIGYNKQPGREWDYIAVSNLNAGDNVHDFTTAGSFAFHIIGNESLKFKFRNADGDESGEKDISVAGGGVWNLAVVDYSNLDRINCGPSQINEIIIFPKPGAAGSGTFYIDNFVLGTGALQTDKQLLIYIGHLVK